jgi:Type IV pilus assembly protein PilM
MLKGKFSLHALEGLFKAKMPPLIGADISSSAVKMVEIESAGKGMYRIERYAIEPLPKDSVNAATSAWVAISRIWPSPCPMRPSSARRYWFRPGRLRKTSNCRLKPKQTSTFLSPSRKSISISRYWGLPPTARKTWKC